ncbi:Peptidase M23 [Methylophilaceae bacterium]|jgi:murein DD-endopeptidase MepM/ murein hydrolase activator NlpD
MNIIFISNSMAKAKTLSVFQVSAIVLALLVLPVLLTLVLIVPQDTPAQQGVKSSKLRFSFNIGDPQKHLDAYAVQMGELQARIMRLDAQSERLAKLAGEKKTAAPINKSNAPILNAPSPNAPVSKPSAANRGGPLVLSSPYTELDLQKHIAELTARVEFETEYLSELEATLLQQSMLKGVLPNRSPIRAAFNSSSYGWRIDPFNGNKAFHEGLDFSANAGAPIFAAAGGIVSAAETMPDYGKIVIVSHGSGLETRYAHTSKILVKVGDRVEKGQVVALVGNTGRSTGPHLHYEIRLNGNALDPRKYLNARN